LGSIILAFEAFQLLVPDIFIDTMGYAFALSLSSWLFPYVPTGAYVHYPTISSDMLDSLSTGGQGINAGTGVGLRGALKRLYWNLFAFAYSKVGSSIDVVMTNSSWTQSHIKQLWGPYRSKASADIDVVFPPVAVSEFERAISINEETERTQRKPHIIYIAQFRAEKNHELVLSAFANFIHSKPRLPAWPDEPPKLILIGNVREEDEKRIYRLRILARELNISDSVEFVCDAKFSSMLDFMAHASVGVNAMWSEHFGIGVVEYQAAGLISVVNDSGGPKLDIVVDVDGRPTGTFPPLSYCLIVLRIVNVLLQDSHNIGFHASTEQQYADAFLKALSLPRNDALAMRHRARKSARRFTDRAFAEKWIANMDRLVLLQVERTRR
jgi:alpha-1,2-mannosyltransferase